MIHKLFKVQLENLIADSMIVHRRKKGLDQTPQIKFKIALLIQGVVFFCAIAKANYYCYCSSNLRYYFLWKRVINANLYFYSS